jgi:hypothetical protein
MMKKLTIPVVGAWSAILMFPALVAGAAVLSSTGASDLIPTTGAPGREWLVAVAADGRFPVGGWLLILMGFLAMVAFIGFHDVLRKAGPIMIFAPILGVAGMVLVQVSHLIPIAMAEELAPAYIAHGADQGTLGAVSDTLAASSILVNAAGDALVWGVVVPLYAWAILTTRELPRWIGWLGFVVAGFAGWLGLLAPASSVIEGVSNIGFPAFFIFMLSTGIAMLRLRAHEEHTQPANESTLAPSVR